MTEEELRALEKEAEIDNERLYFAQLNSPKKKKKEKRKKEPSPLELAVRNKKGHYFNGTFQCARCKRTFFTGYQYIDGEKEYEVCRYCRGLILGNNYSVRAIYTRM